jgi:hypothetical protein
MPNVSLTAFAKQVGLSRGRISQLVREGLPVDARGRIDPDAGRRWIAENIDPDRRRGGPAKPAELEDGLLGSVARLRGHKLAREAQILDLELRRKSGEVVDRAEAERAIFARARQERDAWLGFASRLTAALAVEGVDPARAFPVIDKAVREQLGELAATPLKLV